jgi:hypothetical protein
MSKQNKVNKNNYVQAGRLTPDDMARERASAKVRRTRTERVKAKAGARGASRPRSAPEE